MLGGVGVLLGLETGNNSVFLGAEVNVEEKKLQVSGCRCQGR